MAVNGSVSKDDVDSAEIPEDDDVDEGDRASPKRAGRGAKQTRSRLPIILIGGVVVAAIAVTAVLVTSGSSSNSTPKAKSGFTAFVDQKAGFGLTYPAAWTATPANDANVPLLLNVGADGLDTVLVRVLPLQTSVDTSNEASIKSVTDAIISGTKVSVLQQQAIKVNGLAGYYYFYSLPKDPTSGTTLVHSHFFVFPPHEMVSLTFQTLDHDFSALAHSFDQVVTSFHTVP
jgi:hypothetical protein